MENHLNSVEVFIKSYDNTGAEKMEVHSNNFMKSYKDTLNCETSDVDQPCLQTQALLQL